LRVNESNTLVIVSTGYPDGQKQEIILSYPVSKAHSISHTTLFASTTELRQTGSIWHWIRSAVL